MFVRTYNRLILLAVGTACLTPVLILAATHQMESAGSNGEIPFLSSAFLSTTATGVLVSLLIVFVLNAVLRNNLTRIEKSAEEQCRYLDRLPLKWVGPSIAIAAGLCLFLELAIIRWQLSIFPLLSFYKNFGLLSCFAGLGLGYALSSRRHIPLFYVVPLLGVQILGQLVMKYGLGEDRLMGVNANPIAEQLTMGIESAEASLQYGAIYFALSSVFLLTALAFIPLGQLAGRLMARKENLRAYSLNLLGSLGGVALMQVMSLLWTPPIIWFAIAFATVLPFLLYSKQAMVSIACVSLGILALISWPVNPAVQQFHSPYQLIERDYEPDGRMVIRAAGYFFQTAHNLSLDEQAKTSDPAVQAWAGYYELPYRVSGKAEKVAVVGAGTGNDVAAALRMGAEEVHGVEIDPVVVELGRLGHPEQPYSDPRATAVVEDARSFFRQTSESFDLIVYGLLDSHSVLSHASSARVDSFVYTVEGIREARSRLTDDGILSLSFFVLTPELAKKIYLTMEEAFDGRPPVVLRSANQGIFVFMQGNDRALTPSADLLASANCVAVTEAIDIPEIVTDVATDDWPFFYMPRRVYPFSYLGMVATILLLSAFMTRSFIRERPEFGHSVFFLLGAGFMLIETRGITELGLLFGNTWQVIGIVIAGALIMAFLANLVVERFRIQGLAIPFALLIAGLLGGWVVAQSGGLPFTPLGKLGSVALLTCPIFFSGIVFSAALGRGGDISGIMAANLMGALFGGVLEYNSMRFGFESLYLFGVALYGMAAVAHYVGPLLKVPKRLSKPLTN